MSNIESVGDTYNIWTPWREPISYTKRDIPKTPGEYQLGLFNDDNKIEVLNFVSDPSWSKDINDRHSKGAELICNVIYIGKAVCLYDRFWKLVKSWGSNPPSALHDSKKTFDQDVNLQAQITPHTVKCRYRSISKVNWYDRRKKGFEQKLIKTLWPDIGTDRKHDSAAASTFAETESLKKYKKYFGHYPILNKKGPEILGEEVTLEWLENYWLKNEKFEDEDDGVEME